MKKFEFLEHPADLKIRAFGKDKKELFKNLMVGAQSALRPEIIGRLAETKIKIDAEDLESLVVDFLDEINYLNEVNKEVYQRIEFENFSDTGIEADLFGKKVKRFGRQIKGVTFHDLAVKQEENGRWQAVVLFDV